jgi:hypothetical protein
MSSAYVAKELRERVSRQARYRCGYCLIQEELIGMRLEIDHLIPRSMGGPTREENLWLACSFCNEYKSTRVVAEDPESGRVVRLFNPRYQVWTDHFSWTESGVWIVGETVVGRATVEALRLNRPHLVRSRRVWVRMGRHPPTD